MPTDAKEIRVGAIGSKVGLERAARWMKRVSSFIPAYSSRLHHSPFPGVDAAFGISWQDVPSHTVELPVGELERRIRYDDPHRRVFDAVDLVVRELKSFEDRNDTVPDLWLVVLPELVSKYGRPLAKVPRRERVTAPDRLGKATADRLAESYVLFDDLEESREPYLYEVNFHNQLKARLLDRRIITQIVRETTLTPEDFLVNGYAVRRLQDPATTAWNLVTTLYYKTAGPPWRLAEVREHVCYIGLVFKVDANRPAHERVCCGAQMFLATGEGVVFRGHLGPWEGDRPGTHHLDRETARQIIHEVVQSYVVENKRPPSELFIHGKTRFNRDEWQGFEEGAVGVGRLTAVQIQKSRDIKAYRDRTYDSPGILPVLRGSAIMTSDRDAYLWTNGYVARFSNYIGWEVPSPLKVSIHRGDADLNIVLRDVLALTKLNFNACIFGDAYR
jgi:hypothetical protein